MNKARLLSFNVFGLLAGLLAAGALLMAGCETPPNADLQESVEFDSTPSHASVSINKTVVGQTPMSMILPKLGDTHVVITKLGFTPVDVYVRAEGKSLSPNPVEVALRTELLPEKPGTDKAAEMAASLENLRKYVAAGSIAPEDAPYVEAQIRNFYK